MEIFALSTLLVAGAGVYLFSKVFPNFKPGEKKIQSDLQQLKADVEPLASQLVELETKDLELLAREEANRSVKKGFVLNVKACFNTIFHEPVVAYNLKKYISKGSDAALYARTSKWEFYYWIRDKGTKIVVGNQYLGMLENGEVLVGGKKNELIARFLRDAEEQLPVLVYGREVASLLREEDRKKQVLSTRAYGFIRDDLTQQEEAILLALTIYELVMRSVPH